MNREEMLEYMPHRGRNVLIDEYEETSERSGRGTLTIAEGDAHGRDLFLVRGPAGRRISPFFLVEHVALVSVLILREEMGGGRLAYFSTVSRYENLGDAAAGETIVSNVARGRDRREFRSFKADLATAGGAPVASLTMMAFLAPLGSAPETGRAPADTTEFDGTDAGRFPGHDPALVFVPDAVYPDDHLLCPGHFPGAPVMMGMTQWLTVAQAAALTAPAGAVTEVSGSGALVRHDGEPVVDVTGMRLSVSRDPDGRVTDFRLLGTKRVAFRNPILPGDGYRATFTPA